jgi:hypothetical protein
MLTCQQAKVAYKHVLEVVFQLNDNDPLYKALDTRGYDDVRQLLTMSAEDIDVLHQCTSSFLWQGLDSHPEGLSFT